MVYDPGWPAERRWAIEERTCPARILTLGTTVKSGPARTPSRPTEDTLFYIGFTSGSTGMPKGFERTHGSWLKSFDVTEAEFGIGAGDHVLIVGSLQHSLHLYGAVHALHVGARVTVLDGFDPKVVASSLASGTITALYATPTQLHYVSSVLERRQPVSSLRLVMASGAKWPAEERRRMSAIFPQANLAEFYGASETSFLTVLHPHETPPDGSVGRPVAGVQLRIGDPDGPLLPAGNTGRIWAKSPLHFKDYVCGEGPDTRWRDGWLTVGDHGYLDERGFLFLTGRENRMIISGGLNIYPEEVERVLEEAPDVANAAVFGLPDTARGERLVAVVHPAAGMHPSPEQLYQACVARLGRAYSPRDIHVWRAWPLTAGGKTDLVKIRQGLLEGDKGGE